LSLYKDLSGFVVKAASLEYIMSEEEESSDEEEVNWPCPECGSVFHSRGYFISHLEDNRQAAKRRK
jgi:hypothetical protein